MRIYRDNGFPNQYRDYFFEVIGSEYVSPLDGLTYVKVKMFGFKQYSSRTGELLHDTHTKSTGREGGLHKSAVDGSTEYVGL